MMMEILLVALALAMDAFAVATATGAAVNRLDFRHYFRLGWHFGFFQAIMPIIGWWMGFAVRGLVQDWAHWIAFVLLAAIGIHMFWESLTDESCENVNSDPTRGMSLVMLSVATSIDALAVGCSYSLLGRDIVLPSLVIGLVACVMTCLGLSLGRILGKLCGLGRWAGMVGGVTLVGLGVNTLWQHGVFSF